MKVILHEIKEQETELDFDASEKWVTDAISRVDERLEGFQRPGALSKQDRSVEVHLSMRKVDEVFVITGSVKTQIHLVCSRCANPYQLPIAPSFSALFCKDPVMAGIAYLHRDEYGSAPRPAGQNQGYARHAKNPDHDKPQKDLDITYLSQDFIDLAELLTEQAQMAVPFQPLCQAECKGICSVCGTDLNQGRCACSKIASSQPFSVLKDIKVKTR